MRRFIARVVVNAVAITAVAAVFSLIHVDFTDPLSGERYVGRVLTLGAKRPWLLRPRTARLTTGALESGKGATHDLAPGNGDLIVMGGACQRDWEHSVPYLNKLGVGVRISLQWRYARKVGAPFMGPGWNAPVHYSK